ncbi:MAG: Crp/Fnr family transcriptional regulator [Candidatus Sericytochromatia bacterium]|nr:Crp/Fnr family transcriptional regulator [Candidatus Sericytochromatia bacterium]
MNQVWWGKEADFWRGMTPGCQELIMQRCTAQEWPAGASLLATGDAEGIIAIQSGRVLLVSQRTNERELTLARLGAGEIFGRATWLQHGVAGARVQVIEPLQGWHLERHAMEKLLLENPEATSRLAKSVEALWRVAGPLGPAAGRISRLLRAWGADHGQTGPLGVLVPGILAPAEIAELVGATREEVERCLRTWRAEGRISEERDHYWLKLDPKGLAH